MELSFEYYDWLKDLNSASGVLVFISMFGSLILLIVMALIRRIFIMIGLGAIGNWKFLDDFMVCFGLSGLLGGFLVLIFTFVVHLSGDEMGGVRLLLIWFALFLCITIFYTTNKTVLKKWFREVVPTSVDKGSGIETKSTKGKPQEVEKRRKKMKK